jgi:hypothetical protein
MLGKSMAKLYWRIKKNGKWNWVALNDENTHRVDNLLLYMEGDCECPNCE